MTKSRQSLVSLDEFIIERQKDFPYATGDLSRILRDIGLATKIVNAKMNQAGLTDILGASGQENVHGDEVQKLDVFANKTLKQLLKNGGICSGIASEEEQSFVSFGNQGKYVIAIDPLDGSSNIDVNIPVGTIFSVYRRVTDKEECHKKDFLQKGRELIAAGYIIYGSSTMLVFSTGHGVNGFTLHPGIGEFFLSHPDIKVPEDGKYYSINQGNYNKLTNQGVLQYLDYCLEKERETKRPYSLRYVGSMVADVHRTLIKGGIFMYPATQSSPQGKLRLLYEGNPMSFLMEQAGGVASDGQQRILEVQPEELHQKTPVFMGSSNMVKKALDFVQKGASVAS